MSFHLLRQSSLQVFMGYEHFCREHIQSLELSKLENQFQLPTTPGCLYFFHNSDRPRPRAGSALAQLPSWSLPQPLTLLTGSIHMCSWLLQNIPKNNPAPQNASLASWRRLLPRELCPPPSEWHHTAN